MNLVYAYHIHHHPICVIAQWMWQERMYVWAITCIIMWNRRSTTLSFIASIRRIIGVSDILWLLFVFIPKSSDANRENEYHICYHRLRIIGMADRWRSFIRQRLTWPIGDGWWGFAADSTVDGSHQFHWALIFDWMLAITNPLLSATLISEYVLG